MTREIQSMVLIVFYCVTLSVIIRADRDDVVVSSFDAIEPDELIDFNPTNDVPIDGDRCYHTARRVYGACTAPEKCPEVIRDFKKGIQPQICSYVGTDPVICCPFSRTFGSTTNTPHITTTTTTKSSPSAPMDYTTTRISEIKCEEYSRLGIERDIVGAFSVGERINNTVEKQKCVISSGDGFIVGGTVTKVGEYPHMAVIGWLLDDQMNWNCGGSLISYQFILTAAHCTRWRNRQPDVVRLGEQKLRDDRDNDAIQDIGIKTIIRHPDYKVSSKYNDIALFRLERRAFITDQVRPACLWQTHELGYASAIATGWGLTRDRGQASDDLLKVSLKLISNERCDGFFQRFNALKNGIVDSQLCAGDDVEERDTCNGDSGSIRATTEIRCGR